MIREGAKLRAKEIGVILVDSAINLAVEGDWSPPYGDDDSEAMATLKRGIPLLVVQLKKDGLL